MASQVEDSRTQLQKDIDLPVNPKDSAEAHMAFKQNDAGEADFTSDEADFHKASIRGLKHTQDHVWDPQFLDFSKWLRKTYFKDIGIEEMQAMNKENFYKMAGSLVAQFTLYWLFHFTVPEYFWLWGAPLFVLNCWLVQFGELVHTRSHWPKNMTGSTEMDSIVDSVAIIVTGTSKEGFRRRHIAAHYSDVGNLSRVFSDVWLPFSQFPSTFYMYPHKLLMLFLDVEYCRRENLSRQQLLVEMVGFYTYLCFMMYEVFFCETCFLLVFHMGPGTIYHGSQVLGAMIAHSGIDKRNSFNSNGLFDWREAKGLFKVTLFVVDLFANGGVSNHGIHHAHTQMPLAMINKNLREINAYALKTYKGVRYNNTLTMNYYTDLYESIPEPQWYDYCIQATFTFFCLFYSALIIMGAPLPPPIVFEQVLVDYRFHFYVNKADMWARWRVYADALEVKSRKELIVSPNAYLTLFSSFYPRCDEYLAKHKTTIPVPEGIAERIAPQEVMDFNVHIPMAELRENSKKNQ